MRKIVFALFAVILGCAHAFAEQAPSGIKRTPLQAVDFPEGYKTVTGLAEIAPGGASGLHTHPGIETGYVLEGEVLMQVEGQPDRTLKPGDSYHDPGGSQTRREERGRSCRQGLQRVRGGQDAAACQPGKIGHSGRAETLLPISRLPQQRQHAVAEDRAVPGCS